MVHKNNRVCRNPKQKGSTPVKTADVASVVAPVAETEMQVPGALGRYSQGHCEMEIWAPDVRAWVFKIGCKHK